MDRFKKARGTLEFDKIVQMLVSVSSCPGAKRVAEEITVSDDFDVVKRLQEETTDAKRLLILKGEPHFSSVYDVLDHVDLASRGGTLTPRQLLDTAALLAAAHGTIDYYKTDKKFDTVLDEVFLRLGDDRMLRDLVTRAIISEDTVADEASSKLADIRRKIRNTNAKVRESLQRYITSDTYSKYLQENIITLRNGRYVIPVKQEYKNEIKGLVHDTSSSGATIFIEPAIVLDLNNELKTLEIAEKNEIDRILADLSSRVALSGEIIRLDYYNLVYLASVFARAKLSVLMDGASPKVTRKGELKLIRARHPLLDKSTVVPITVMLGGAYTTLVITGPNTGGKTVTEKTVGLLVLMAQAGLHVPASEETQIPVFDGVMADIGDEQSIEQSLSTFSAHTVNTVNILKSLTENTLAIFDELGAGTDPVEGAALAISVLETVRQSGAKCIATTHYAELKAYAVETEGVCNASCEFDVETLKPTYRLIIGTPGRSNAFAIAEKLGMPKSVIDAAQGYIDSENKQFEDVISRLDAERKTMQEAKDEALRLKEEFESYKRESEKEIREALDYAKKEREKADEQARRTVNAAKATADFVYAELEKVQKHKDKDSLKEEMERSRAAMRDRLKNHEYEPVAEPDEDYVLPRPLKVGDEVYVTKFGKVATVRSLPDRNGNVSIVMGNVAMKVKISTLRLGEQYTARKEEPRKKAPAPEIAPRSIKSDIDVRGMNGEEAWHEVDKYIDEAIMCRLSGVTVIHGKGTGKLRERLQSSLRGDRRVESFRDGQWGEGDAGVTVVTLKHR